MSPNELRGSKGLVIDTNLLIVLVLGSLNPAQISTHNLTHNYTAEDYQLLVSFVSRFRSVVTTPNILTEASNLLGNYTYKNQQALEVLKDIAQTMPETFFASSSTMHTYSKSFLKFGLTDATIHRIATENYLVLTDDLRLCSYLQYQGLTAFNFNNLRDYLLR